MQFAPSPTSCQNIATREGGGDMERGWGDLVWFSNLLPSCPSSGYRQLRASVTHVWPLLSAGLIPPLWETLVALPFHILPHLVMTQHPKAPFSNEGMRVYGVQRGVPRVRHCEWGLSISMSAKTGTRASTCCPERRGWAVGGTASVPQSRRDVF